MEETRPTILYFTGISDLRYCPQRYYANQVLRIEPAVVSDALTDGRTFHGALEAASKKFEPEAQRCAAFGQVRADQDAGRIQPINAARVRAMLSGYFAKWGRLTWTTWAREYRVEGPIPGVEGLTFAGVIDRIVTVPGGFAIVDYKTTSKVDASYLEGLNRRLQGPLYAHYFESEQGQEVVEIVYDLVVKPSSNFAPKKITSGPRKGDRETMAEFEDRLQKVYRERLDEMVLRPTMSITREHRDRALVELIRAAEEVLWRLDTGNWGENRGGCEGTFYPCPYRQLCYSGFSPLVIQNYYRTREDNSLDNGEIKM